MVSRTRGVGGLPLTALALAFGIGVSSGRPAVAQVGFVAPAHGGHRVPPGVYGPPAGAPMPGLGTFGPGYPGFGLEYGPGCVLRQGPFLRGLSIHNWGRYVLGKEDLYPYIADPYGDPAGAMVPWPPYSAPVAAGY